MLGSSHLHLHHHTTLHFPAFYTTTFGSLPHCLCLYHRAVVWLFPDHHHTCHHFTTFTTVLPHTCGALPPHLPLPYIYLYVPRFPHYPYLPPTPLHLPACVSTTLYYLLCLPFTTGPRVLAGSGFTTTPTLPARSPPPPCPSHPFPHGFLPSPPPLPHITPPLHYPVPHHTRFSHPMPPVGSCWFAGMCGFGHGTMNTFVFTTYFPTPLLLCTLPLPTTFVLCGWDRNVIYYYHVNYCLLVS